MPRRTRPATRADTTTPPQPIADAVDERAAEQAAPPPEPEQPKKRDFHPILPEPGFGGETHVLPDGTVARLADSGNRGGIVAQFRLPEGLEKPEPDVTAPLKEHRPGHTNFRYTGGAVWHKPVTGPGLDPAVERADATDRFRQAVEARRRHAEEPGEGPSM